MCLKKTEKSMFPPEMMQATLLFWNRGSFLKAAKTIAPEI